MVRSYFVAICVLALWGTLISAQDRFGTMPPSGLDSRVQQAGKESAYSLIPDECTVTCRQDMPVTMKLNPDTLFPENGPPYSLFSPYGIEVRFGPALSTGRGPLAGLIKTGRAMDLVARSYWYEDCTAAWFGELGFSYIYNNGKADDVAVTLTGQFGVTRFGQTIPLDGTATLSLTQLHRFTPRIGFGREYYWDSAKYEGVRYYAEMDVGGQWGYATRKTNLLNIDFGNNLQNGDVILHNTAFSHKNDVLKGFYFGGSAGVAIPFQKYDLTLGMRLEWGRDYFQLVDDDDGNSQLKLMLVAGVRW